jgi:hypothetical protein
MGNNAQKIKCDLSEGSLPTGEPSIVPTEV